MGQTLMQNSVEEDVAAVAEAVAPDRHAPTHHGRMLLIEDGPCAKETADAIMGWTDMEVETVENARIACVLATLSLTEERPYDVVFIETQMPNGSGAEAIKWLRQQGWQVPILGIGVNISDEDRQRFLAAGCDDFIEKPLTDPKLQAAFVRLVNQKIDETIPAVLAEERAASDGTPHVVSAQNETPSSGQKSAKLPAARVLVVEDARCTQAIIGALLQEMNVDVDLADNGLAACEMAMQSLAMGSPYDAILMDIQMPKMDGKQATKWLRENNWQGPIIAISGHNAAKDHTAFTNAGGNNFIAKPLTKAHLRDVLSQYLHCE
jgi:CheY-like chemotaxis protein